MKAKNARNKGNRYEIHLESIFRDQVDTNTRRTSASGAGLNKNDLRIPSKNWEIEAKNAQTVSLIKDWEQSRRQTTSGNKTALAIRNPKKPEFEETLIVISLGDFIEFLNSSGCAGEVTAKLDPNMKWKLQRLINDTKEVMKEIGKTGLE